MREADAVHAVERLELAGPTRSALSYVPTTVPLIEHVTWSPFTDTAMSWVTFSPVPAALWIAAFGLRAAVHLERRGPKPRTMNRPSPYAAQ